MPRSGHLRQGKLFACRGRSDRGVSTSTGVLILFLQMRQLCLKDIGRLNSFILDFSDTFWRYKAFNPTDKNSVFFPISCTQLEAIRVRCFTAQSPLFVFHLLCRGLGGGVQFRKECEMS